MCDIAILVVGFSRPSNTLSALNLILPIIEGRNHLKLYISIDGPRKDNDRDFHNQKMFDDHFQGCVRHNKVNVIRHKENLGVDKHIPDAISEILTTCAAVLVLEDDIKIAENSLLSMLNMLTKSVDEGSVSPILGMSGLTLPSWLESHFRTYWRHSIYFSAWAYGLTREFWVMHMSNIARKDSDSDLGSDTWNFLSSRQKKLWEERFSRLNYDYLIQFTLFKNGIESIAPMFRLIDNIGFEDHNATHTKQKRPRYLTKLGANSKLMYDEIYPSVFTFSCFWKIIDSNTWGGDGLLSKRGRNCGIRTSLRKLFTKFGRNHDF